MRVFMIIFLCIYLAFTKASTEESWREFKLKHGKVYKNLREEKLRYDIFQSNLKEIEKHNARYNKGEVTWYKKVTKFADLTQEEFKKWLDLNSKSKPIFSEAQIYHPVEGEILPDSIDWKDRGAVLAVQDQGSCGSCWAFSSAGSVEGQNAIKNNKSIVLSAQNLVDCSTENDGCGGGLLSYAMDYIKEYGLESAEDYPYEGANQECAYDISKIVIKISSVMLLSPHESALLSAVGTTGPVSAAMDASYLQLYGGGVYVDALCIPGYLNHAVLVYGYGKQGRVPYFNVKNSWGTDWGEEGFFRIARDAGFEEGVCGIASSALYPIL